MLNRVILMGRITHDLEVRQSQSGTAVLRFMVAVDRYSKTEDKQSDFITCVAFGQRAEFIAKYFGKGIMIAIEGNIRTGSYDDKNGVRHYTTDIWVDSVSFTGEKSENVSQNGYQQGYSRNVSQPSQQSNNQSINSSDTPVDLSDFEDVLSDNGVPF